MISFHKKELISMFTSDLLTSMILGGGGGFVRLILFFFYQTANHNQGLLKFLKVSNFEIWAMYFPNLVCNINDRVSKLPGMCVL